MDAKPYTEEEWQKECATGEDTDGAKMTALFRQVVSLKEALGKCAELLMNRCECYEECTCVPDNVKALLEDP